ncbi:hypothetical protein BLA60_15595 [Actinophytocola xinjiangensis]|uniref:Uncharacterized protein n=2 Tax=Actinophytocola xinjiangensis TaxID=485602 RepID=A0A7Z0WMM2_9PSEU|nr:hypothetical protein BLA60_15595 [Actinophytocola xinjiangensis]
MISVYVVMTDQLKDIAAAGAEHPVFGGLFDQGTVAALTGFGTDVADEIGQVCREVDLDGTRLRVATISLDTSTADDLRELLEGEASAAAVCVVLAGTGSDPLPPLLVVAGTVVPAMGVVPDCDRARLVVTFEHLVGQPDPDQDSLFTEPAVPESLMEEQLSERLKQLYGE